MRGSEHSRGVTLVELAAVVGILAILALLAVPSMMRMVKRSALNGEARKLYAAFLTARSHAQRTGIPHALELDRHNRRLLIKADGDLDGTFEALVWGYVLSGSYVEFGPINGYPDPFSEPYHEIARGSWCAPFPQTSQSCTIEFAVDGTVSSPERGGSVVVHDASGTVGVIQALVFVGATADVRLFSKE